MTASDDTLERKIDAVAEEVSSMHEELPQMIAAAVEVHETAYIHMTPEAYREMLGGKTPGELIEDHDTLAKGHEFLIGQFKAFTAKQDEILINQHYIAEVVLGPEFTNYDGETERSGGLQDLVAEYQNGEIKTRLTTRDRVALYVAAIGGFAAIGAALIISFM